MDREVKEQYQVLIQAKDMGGQLGGLAGTTTVNITLTDVNDNPPRFPKSKFSIIKTQNERDFMLNGTRNQVGWFVCCWFFLFLYNLETLLGKLLTENRYYSFCLLIPYIICQNLSCQIIRILFIIANSPQFKDKFCSWDVSLSWICTETVQMCYS